MQTHIAEIEAAATRIAGQIERTPCLPSRTLSEIAGAEVWVKFENLQFTSSFKERGALNYLLGLEAARREAGVIAASAGNHAQGVSYHAKRLGIPAVIVMPKATPAVKVARTRGFGAEVVLWGDSFDEARERAIALAGERCLTWIHPYDDPAIIAGQGTLGLELAQQVPGLDAVLVPVGGGGLIAGIAGALRARSPRTAVIGVQTERYPGMFNLFHGRARPVERGTIAEGIAVIQPGTITAGRVRDMVADMVLVDETAIEEAILLLLEVEKTVVEGAGAAGLAALLRHRGRFDGQRLAVIASGGNIDPILMMGILERGMVRSGRLARVRISVRDAPGALARITALIADCQANIEEVHHQRAFSNMPLQNAEVEVVLQTRGHEHVAEVIAALHQAGFDARLPLSGDLPQH